MRVINSCSLHHQTDTSDILKMLFKNLGDIFCSDDKSLKNIIWHFQNIAPKMRSRNHTGKAFRVWVNGKKRNKFIVFPKHAWSLHPTRCNLAKRAEILFCFRVVKSHIVERLSSKNRKVKPTHF